MQLRDKSRYGIFRANSNIGIVLVDISIRGFGERIIVSKNKKELYSINTLDYIDENDIDYDLYDYKETDELLVVEDIQIEKPFIKCLKRYR